MNVTTYGASHYMKSEIFKRRIKVIEKRLDKLEHMMKLTEELHGD